MRTFCVLLFACCAVAAVSAQMVTTESLLREMTDLAGMAEFPDPPYTCRQFSSYDRASKSAADSKGWFANGDLNQYLRVEEVDSSVDGKPAKRKEHVMMDTAGPGAIVRMWSANPAGTLRIYLDNDPKPVIECPMNEWLGGTYPGVPKPIAGERSKGWNSYFPIGYAKHCKVTSDKDGFYYHVNYRTYRAGTAIRTFARSELIDFDYAINRVTAELTYPVFAGMKSKQGEEKQGEQGTWLKISLEPGKSEVIDFQGPACLVLLGVSPLTTTTATNELRSVLVRMEFDDQKTVMSPLGDFFGCAPAIREFSSLPIFVNEIGHMLAKWRMPFAKSARISLENHSPEPVSFRFVVYREPYSWTDRSMHFHAKWRQQMQVPTRPMIDWNYLTATGQGVFAGVSFSIANPVKHWWGEGDEKIYVDGETFPSHFGTGTEDYFGYAWCWPQPFTHAYHNQPRCDGPGNFGFTTVNRFHILDRIPFTKSFKFDMELWHWHEKCNVDMSVVAYWYARPGGKDEFAAIKPEDLVLPTIPPYVPMRVAGAIEGEKLRIVNKVGLVDPQVIDGCSDDQHLWWHQDQKPGDKLTLALPVEKGGKYRVKIRCLMARDYGIHQIWIDDTKAGQPIDFFNDGIKMGPEIDLGEHDLKTGEVRLTAEVVGANEKAVKSYMFGLDYVKLEPAP